MATQAETALESGKTFLNQVVAGKYAEAASQFDKTMTEMMPVEGLKAAWEQVQVQAGKFHETLDSKVELQEGYGIVLHTLRFERGKLLCRLVYSGDNKMGGLLFAPAD